MYRFNIDQQIRCGDISLQSKRKEQSLGTLKTTYLAKMNKVELISEGHGNKKN